MESSIDAYAIFKNLKGEWSFVRSLKDLLNDKIHMAQGTVGFEEERSENRLRYNEKGILKLEGEDKEFSFQRKYLFILEEGMIKIIFDDGISKGKVYQVLKPYTEDTFMGTDHMCVNDLYKGEYRFNADKDFFIKYTINGPKKNWVIETNFKKI